MGKTFVTLIGVPSNRVSQQAGFCFRAGCRCGLSSPFTPFWFVLVVFLHPLLLPVLPQRPEVPWLVHGEHLSTTTCSGFHFIKSKKWVWFRSTHCVRCPNRCLFPAVRFLCFTSNRPNSLLPFRSRFAAFTPAINSCQRSSNFQLSLLP